MTSRPLRLLQTSILSTFDWTSLALATLTRRRRTRVLTSESQTEGGGGARARGPPLSIETRELRETVARGGWTVAISGLTDSRARACALHCPPPLRAACGGCMDLEAGGAFSRFSRAIGHFGGDWHIRHSGGRCVGVKNALKSIIYRLYMLSISRVCGEPPGLCRPPGLPRTGSH